MANVAFCVTRLLLLLGRFSYSRQGVISLRQHRLFTLRSVRKLFNQNGFQIVTIVGVPLPYERFFQSEPLARLASALHAGLIRLWKGLFGYQFLVVSKPLPSLHYLLRRAEQVAGSARRSCRSAGDEFPPPSAGRTVASAMVALWRRLPTRTEAGAARGSMFWVRSTRYCLCSSSRNCSAACTART